MTLVISSIGFFGVYALIELMLKEPFAEEIIRTGLKVIKKKR